MAWRRGAKRECSTIFFQRMRKGLYHYQWDLCWNCFKTTQLKHLSDGVECIWVFLSAQILVSTTLILQKVSFKHLLCVNPVILTCHYSCTVNCVDDCLVGVHLFLFFSLSFFMRERKEKNYIQTLFVLIQVSTYQPKVNPTMKSSATEAVSSTLFFSMSNNAHSKHRYMKPTKSLFVHLFILPLL